MLKVFKTRPNSLFNAFHQTPILNQRQLVGSNVEGIDIGGETGVGLLGTVGAGLG